MSSTDEKRSDEELMQAYVGGDDEALRELFERYAPMLMNLTRRHLYSEEDAREVVQQTFFQLHQARHDFRLDARLRPWVFTIAMNLVRQHYRKKSRRRESEFDEYLAPTAAEQETPIESQERSAWVRAALERLPRNQREVIELHWFQERPFAEVASILGASEGAVRVRAHRAYNKLKVLLASRDDMSLADEPG